MSKLRANDPCPCGSGKKYKRCCRNASGDTRTAPPSGVKPLVDAAMKSYQKGKLAHSKTLCEKALAIGPLHVGALRLKAKILRREGRLADALTILAGLVKDNPGDQELLIELADTYKQKENYQRALAIYQTALKVGGWSTHLYASIGDTCHKLGDYGAATTTYKKALENSPKDAAIHNALGFVFLDAFRYDEAITCFKQAIKLNPALIRAHNNLGCAWQASGNFDEAQRAFSDALVIDPRYVTALCNLASLHKDQGLIEKAVKAYRRAYEMEPDNRNIQDNYLTVLNYSDTLSRKEVYEEHRRIGRRIELNVPQVRHGADFNSKSSGPLKIGYLSPDFNDHAVASFILPVLRSHNHQQVTIYCYYNRNPTDHVTEQIKGLADYWRPIASMNDATVARLIQQDGIDILVDLAGHTAGGRLGVFARKPAPVQVAWIGYPNTTGLSAMDFRITDLNADPPGETEQYYTETLMHMPKLFSVYSPPSKYPPVSVLPMSRNGYVTYGCFNNIAKLSDSVVDTWSHLLREVPDSRLMLKYKGLASENLQNSLRCRFSDCGINGNRLILCGGDASRYDHLQRYGEVDIALDVFPYNGTTTTCEALWMGVPVVGLKGDHHASRVTFSIMKTLGLGRYIGTSQQEYIEVASSLASDVDDLKSLREYLRENMQESPITDSQHFTRHLESKFLEMWDAFIRNKAGGGTVTSFVN
ncbi:MAG: tetratricopeptide repeat protein [Gammaproteobacteria bacterium]|nr:tetratricopeptide repeat protein [Gammaproteobacteria bacterium]